MKGIERKLARTQRPAAPGFDVAEGLDKTDTHKKGRILMRPFLL
jgi:hypothetical protein